MENNDNIKFLIEDFETLMQENAAEGTDIPEEKIDKLAGRINDVDTLKAGLPDLYQKSEDMKTSIENCDRQIKTWQESKKIWKKRHETFMAVLEKIIGRLKVSGNSVKEDGIKLAVSSRTAIEVDEDWLLGQFEESRKALQLALPEYVKVSLSIDKNKLSAYLKTDNSMLVKNPEKIHNRVATSCTIKG